MMLGVIPMIEVGSCASSEAAEDVQSNAQACDDIPCNCDCDCYDCVDQD